MSICLVDACDKPQKGGSSACGMHTSRMRRHGSYDTTLRVRFDVSDVQQIQARLLGRRVIGASGCWLWNGAYSADGYGQVGSGGQIHYVHQLAAKAWHVEGDGPCVLHHCDVRHCFNPEHLYRGTKQDNAADMWARGRAWQQQVSS